MHYRTIISDPNSYLNDQKDNLNKISIWLDFTEIINVHDDAFTSNLIQCNIQSQTRGPVINLFATQYYQHQFVAWV